MATKQETAGRGKRESSGSPSTRAPLKRRDPDFRPDIEGLRGIAVLIVVAYHVGIKGFQGGFVGVDVFFVLSGYLITSLLMREVRKTSRISFSSFYARRVRRLLPAAALTIFATMALSITLASPLEQFTFSRAARATALYVSNIWLTLESLDYFGPGVASNPLLHTWSLAVEEQFYFIWPAIIWFGLCRLRTRRALIWTMVAVSFISFVASVLVTRWNAPWAFFGSPARAWEFGLGGLASLFFREKAPDSHRALWLGVGWLGIAAIVISSLVLNGQMLFPGYLATLPVLGTVFALVAGSSRPGEGIGHITDHPVMQRIGKLSYSWYLWHWPALVFLSFLVPLAALWMKLLAATAALGMAVLTKVMVEDPVRYNRWLIVRPRVSIALALLLTVSTAAVATYEKGRAVQAMNQPAQKLIREAADVEVLPDNSCLVPQADSKIRECYGGSGQPTRQVILFGDSKAAHWFPALNVIAQQNAWKLISLVKANCPAVTVDVYNVHLRRTESECTQWRTSAIARIEELNPLLVVMSSTDGYVQGTPGGEFGTLTNLQWEEGTNRTLIALRSRNVSVLVIRDSPNQGINTPICLSRAAAHRWYPIDECTTDSTRALDNSVRDAELRSVSHFPNTSYADFSSTLCPKGLCNPTLNGVVVYRDRSHLTFAMSQTLAPDLNEQIVKLLAKTSSQTATFTSPPQAASRTSAAKSVPRTD